MMFIIAFRSSNFFSRNRALKIIGLPIRLLYKIIFQWILGIDIDDTTHIGFGFNVYHGQGLIINRATIIGKNLIVRHCTTIGNSKFGGKCPVVGNNVNIGANSVIIGDIRIGDNAIIGAGSVVVKDVPENAIVCGNPAKVVKYIN